LQKIKKKEFMEKTKLLAETREPYEKEFKELSQEGK
jgi:hypothetical protein